MDKITMCNKHNEIFIEETRKLKKLGRRISKLFYCIIILFLIDIGALLVVHYG